ncbi:MAG: prenyltransferase [Candidatus Omnitrophota bacterium]|jgi:1,4-dihydroxy-2-naphthoate octaprenyltransferase
MKTIIKWILLARLPFHFAGALPFVAGSLLALRTVKVFNFPVFLWGLGAVVLIMLSANFNGEIYDINEDRFSAKLGRSPFYGGSQVIVDGLVSSDKVDLASRLIIISACAIGLLLQFYFKTGPWTIPLGLSGIITGFYYSKPPLRWVKRGIGELFIAYSYGWLPLVVGFYLQAGSINSHLNWIAIPIACSIFNVILINEFPDYQADIQANKRNLVVRLGKEKAAFIYLLVAISGIIIFLISLTKGLPLAGGLFYLPVGVISLLAICIMASGNFNNRVLLERMCLLTILVNIGVNLVYIGILLF